MRQKIPEFACAVWCLLILLLLSALGACAAVPQFLLRDTVGLSHAPAEWSGQKAIVLFFVTTDCPIANSYVPEMNRIRETYAPRGVRVYAVQADTSIAEAAVADYAKDYRYSFPLLLDPQQVLGQFTGATVTPEAVVLSPEGKLHYRGRIDNRVEDFGKQRPEATKHDLRDALDAVLAGRPVRHRISKSIGCPIPEVK
jgi:peroxiredoxin